MTLATRRCSRVCAMGPTPKTSWAVREVNVFAALEGVGEDGVAGEVREDAQLDLGVVRGKSSEPAGATKRRGFRGRVRSAPE